MGYNHHQSVVGFDHEAGSQRSNLAVCPREPKGSWKYPAAFNFHNPTIIVSVDGSPDQFLCVPFDVMETNEYGHGENPAPEREPPFAPGQGNLWAPNAFGNGDILMSIGHFYAEPSAVRPFFDPHHVSPAASSLFGSPSINNEPRLPLDRSRVACQTYHDTWPAPASYAPNSPTNFSVFPDRQTAPELVTHGLPNFPVPYVNGWSYGNTSNVPMDATESTGQANLYMTGGDSFSSVSSSTSSSSTSSSSFNNRLTVPSCWQTKTVSSNIVSSTYNPSSPCDGLQVSSWGPWMPENRRLEGTVSPKLTRIQPSPSYASAASSPGNMLAGWESDAAHSSSEPGRDPPFPGPRQQETTSSSKRQRRKLPQGKMSRPRHLRGKQSPKPPANLRSSECGSVPSSPPTARPSKANKNSKDTSTEDPSTPAEEEVIMADRKAADEFLVRSRLAGMGYKDIKERGGFSAAESTLRGRFRMLTKPKEARVRRPMWSDKDIRLLEESVRKLAVNGDILESKKIPWKAVSDHIVEMGGTYQFGISTCRKRWDELAKAEIEKGKDPALPFYS